MYSITPVPDSDGKSDLETVFIELMPNTPYQRPSFAGSNCIRLLGNIFNGKAQSKYRNGKYADVGAYMIPSLPSFSVFRPCL